MSAVIVKGIIISLSVVAAVGLALQTPEVRDWVDEQRRKISELLRSVSDGLDADTRREAEAFAFEGRMPHSRDPEGALDVWASATGRQLDSIAVRRMNGQTTSEAIDAAERRRMGREYLARRNQEMLDMRRRREASDLDNPPQALPDSDAAMAGSSTEKIPVLEAPLTPLAIAAASFGTLIERHGSLRADEKQLSSPSTSSQAATVIPNKSTAFDVGAAFGNPFGDEFTIDRSTTPKPPLPPKVPMSPAVAAQPIRIPITSPEDEPEAQQEEASHASETSEELSYDEQLARALSLSLADKEEKARKTLRRTMTEEEAFARAIVESLKEDTPSQKSAQDLPSASRGPLVDLSATSTSSVPASAPGQPSNNPWRSKSPEDDLYFLTPMPTGQVRRSRLLDEEGTSSLAAALAQHTERTRAIEEAHARARAAPLSVSRTLSPESRPAAPLSATLSPLLAGRDDLSSGFTTDSEADEYASLPGSGGQSIASMVEVEDVGIESLDEDDDGITTPSSWSEISSQVDESDHSELGAGETVAR